MKYQKFHMFVPKTPHILKNTLYKPSKTLGFFTCNYLFIINPQYLNIGKAIDITRRIITKHQSEHKYPNNKIKITRSINK